MSDFKIAGACTVCDKMCFEVIEPKRLGPPLPGATRISFMLMDGTKTSLTFCEHCTQTLTPDTYSAIWQKILRSWTNELSDKPAGERNPEWLGPEFGNGILCEMGRESWTELVKHG